MSRTAAHRGGQAGLSGRLGFCRCHPCREHGIFSVRLCSGNLESLIRRGGVGLTLAAIASKVALIGGLAGPLAFTYPLWAPIAKAFQRNLPLSQFS